MGFDKISFTVDGGIARITLERPDELNAMSASMGEEIRAAVALVNADESARVCIVSGRGRAFSSGANLKTLGKEAGLADQDAVGLGGGAAFYRLFLSIRDLRVPSIAAMNGHAIGAGFCFALGADLRVAKSGSKFGMTFVKLGIHPGMAATWNLPRLIGPSRAADLLYTGRTISAEEAFQMGIVNRVAGEDFDQVVDELAGQIAASGPLAVRSLKDTLRGSFERSIGEAIEMEAERQEATFKSSDAAEGMSAILAKRKPEFTGR